jgi:hypothetical protein
MFGHRQPKIETSFLRTKSTTTSTHGNAEYSYPQLLVLALPSEIIISVVPTKVTKRHGCSTILNRPNLPIFPFQATWIDQGEVFDTKDNAVGSGKPMSSFCVATLFGSRAPPCSISGLRHRKEQT